MRSKSSPEESKSTSRRGSSLPTVLLLVAVFSTAAALVASTRDGASEEPAKDAKALSTANALALPDTYLVTVALEDFGDTLEFSSLTAQRHFSLAPAESRIQFRGRLWLQRDGRELLDFSIEFTQELPTAENRAPRSRSGTWHGSTYVASGQPIEVVTNPDSKITVTLTKQ